MKKFGILLLAFTAVFGSLNADEVSSASIQSTFVYGATGLFFPIQAPIFSRPFVGFGLRTQSGHLGADLSVNGTIFFSDVYTLNGNCLFLYYPKPNLQNEYYFGLGAGVTTTHPYSLTFISPEFVFGKQYRTNRGRKHFVEAQFIPYTFYNGNPKERIPFPSVSIRYGVGF